MHPCKKAWRRARRAYEKFGCFGMQEGRGFQGRFQGQPDDANEGGGFGVRRPLRFLARKLNLDENQTAALAGILEELKTERAQGEVDRRRSIAAFADAVAGDTFDEPRAAQGGDLRVDSARRLRDAVIKALRQIHGLLNAEQRAKLSHMIRTGVVVL